MIKIEKINLEEKIEKINLPKKLKKLILSTFLAVSLTWCFEKSTEQKAFNFIIWVENFSNHKYNDYKQESIWYWTKANWRIKITKRQAEIETRAKIKKIHNFIKNRYPNIKDENLIISLISFFYNTWMWLSNKKNLDRVLRNYWKIHNWRIIDNLSVKNRLSKYIYVTKKNWKKVKKKWLQIRREKEIMFFYK